LAVSDGVHRLYDEGRLLHQGCGERQSAGPPSELFCRKKMSCHVIITL